MQKITPFLWFDDNAEDAVNFYTSVFPDSNVGNVSRYPEGTPGPTGSVMVATFELFGQNFIALNGGPVFKFTPAISFVVSCDSQDEVDYYWQKLTEGGQEVECGWLTDKFGLSWQIVPGRFNDLMSNATPEQSKRIMAEVMKMTKFDIATIERAYNSN